MLALAQTQEPQLPPQFTRGGVRQNLLAPGMIIELYGAHFGPSPSCPVNIPQNGPYPLEACNVSVLVDGHPAELLYVGNYQINFKIPADAPEEGTAPIQVCVRDQCSDPVEFRFSAHKAYIHVQGKAYVHMPVWIEAEQPQPYFIQYPARLVPWDFGGSTFEVLHNGRPMTPVHQPLPNGGTIAGGSIAPSGSPPSRLPLHLLYHFDEPGTYSIRFTTWKYGADHHTPEIACQSDWTEIIVEPFTAAQRDAWLAQEAAKARTANPGQLIGDILPSLLAWPDEKALLVIRQILDNPNQLVRLFARQSLSAFDPELVRRMIPPGTLNGDFSVILGGG